MQTPAIPDSEQQRLSALRDTGLLDTVPETRFDRLTNLAQLSLGTEIVLISLVDSDRQWFKSKQGLDACETARDVSFCGHTILGEGIFEVPNALLDNRFADNPLVLGGPNIRFYAGVPLVSDGEKIGTLCFIDSKPRTFTDTERQIATEFGKSIEQEIQDRLQDHAHQQLAAREQMYRSVLEGTKIGTWQWNVQTGETVLNERWADIMGYTLAELEPISVDTWLNLLHPDDVAESDAQLEDHLNGKNSFFDIKCRMKHKDGHYVWVHDRGKVVTYTDDGKPHMMYGTHADITQQKLGQIALQQSRDQLYKLTQELPGVVYQYQSWPDGRNAFPYASSAIKDIYGVTPEEVLTDASNAFAKIYQDDLTALVDSIQHSIDTLSVWELEYRVVDDNGLPKWLSGSATPERMPDGSTLWHGYIQDITQTKEHYLKLEQLNHQLNIAQQSLDLASEQAQIGYWQASLKHGTLWWSPMIYQIFGLNEQDFSPSVSLFKSAVHPDDVVKVEQSEDQARITGIHNVIHRIIRPSGEVRWVHELGQLVSEDKNPDLIMIGSVQDITDAMKLQKIKDDFISTVSHELRTPLTSISGALNLLQSGKIVSLPEKAQKLMDIASSNCLQLSRLINDLLDIEKLAAGKMLFEMKPLVMPPLLLRALNDHQPYAAQHNITLALLHSPQINDATIYVDEHRLLQILTNFLSNAVKFSPQNGKVTLSALVIDDHIEIAVQDQGSGIPDDFKDKIFEKFSQADASSSKAKGGTGLGLALCKELIGAMNGSIGYQSEPGSGARFYVRLPIMK
ncbi:PAS domain-containing protein [Shewanella basaltis]|uniref:PAS domain-containing protein n=1 Tax=Shewanella basaltis TaxID=472183 RepID=UPI00200E4DEA|nr:PAS domain-containing protein [Shewanella basaltis]MCL1114498.1 PAS domain-containing protein [Shewanella basaltis]